MQSLVKFALSGVLLGAALWLTARFAAAHILQLSTLRDEAALLLLILVGTTVYAGSIRLMFGRGWLRSLVQS